MNSAAFEHKPQLSFLHIFENKVNKQQHILHIFENKVNKQRHIFPQNKVNRRQHIFPHILGNETQHFAFMGGDQDRYLSLLRKLKT